MALVKLSLANFPLRCRVPERKPDKLLAMVSGRG